MTIFSIASASTPRSVAVSPASRAAASGSHSFSATASGMSEAELRAEYPALTREDILAAIAWSRAMDHQALPRHPHRRGVAQAADARAVRTSCASTAPNGRAAAR